MSDEVSDETIEKKAHECVEYILFCVLAERKSIIRRSELNKHVNKEYMRCFKLILKQIQLRLYHVFGLELVDLDGKKEKSERFGIRSKFDYDAELNKLDMSDGMRRIKGGSAAKFSNDMDKEFEDQFKYGVLMIALSLILMNGNEIDGELFWDSLKKLGINRDEKKHKFFGDVSKFFTGELVKEGYLEHELQPGTEPHAYKFKWGYRARVEITKMSVLEFVCKIYGGVDVCKPNEWMAQFADANKRDVFNRSFLGDGPDDEMEEDEAPAIVEPTQGRRR